MRSFRGASSTARALHRVFVAPIERSMIPTQSTLSRNLAWQCLGQQVRYGSAQRTPRRLPRDDEIRARYVYIVGEDGKLPRSAQGELLPPHFASDLLRSTDRKTHTIVTVSMPKMDQSKNEKSQEALEDEAEDNLLEAENKNLEYPIVRIFEKKQLFAAEKLKRKAVPNPALTVKKIELNWAIDPHDLGHRLNRLQEFLQKGFKVEILMMPKRKGRRATPEEVQNLLAAVKGKVEEVGAKEWKAMDGQPGKQTTIFAEGKKAA